MSVNYCWYRQRRYYSHQKEIIMLKDIINTTIKQDLINKIGKKRNIFSLPHLSKVVVNYRVSEARESQESLAAAIEEITAITGQKPQLCKAKKAVSAFKLRQNDPLLFEEVECMILLKNYSILFCLVSVISRV